MLTFNEHSVMFRTTINDDLCDFVRSFVAFVPHESHENWLPIRINVTEGNTLPVLYNINSSTVKSQQHQHYILVNAKYCGASLSIDIRIPMA